MILIDANVFLRYLTHPDTDKLRAMNRMAMGLMEKIQSGELVATTSEVVLHEVCFILGSTKHYSNIASDIIIAMRDILMWPGWVFPSGDHETYLRALDLWEGYSALEFSDAVIAARCERGGRDLATFDRHFDAIASIGRWPMTSDSTG
jgi:predicted nucleic acid-binding protein